MDGYAGSDWEEKEQDEEQEIIMLTELDGEGGAKTQGKHPTKPWRILGRRMGGKHHHPERELGSTNEIDVPSSLHLRFRER